MTALDKFREVSNILRSYGIDDAPKEAEILITEALRIDKASLYSGSFELRKGDSERIDSLVHRRSRREPLQYILGYVEFLGLRFNLGKGVLIPRPETEVLAMEAIKMLKARRTPKGRVLDLCTGSGCIAIAIAKNLPEITVYGTDVSDTALRYAEENALLNKVENVIFLRGDLYEPLNSLGLNMGFDMIVSNPPYIKRDDISTLQPEIRDWEPPEALNGGIDGLDYYRRILGESRDFLSERGVILLEVGDSKGVIEIARGCDLKVLSIIKDLAGIERVIVLSH